MEGGVITDVIVPICLALMMVGLGMTLTVADFRRVLVYPKATATGLACQMILLPALGFAIVSSANMAPEFAVGFMLLAACPGGVTSNIITHLAKGDTALAVTLTVVSSSFSLITIPLIVTISLTRFMGVDSVVELPILETVIKVFALTIPTVVLGMLIKWEAQGVAKKAEKPINVGGLLFLLVLIVGVTVKEKELLMTEFLNLGPVLLLLCVSTGVLSYLAARLLKLPLPQRLSVSIGAGFQNVALALVIATSFIKNAQMAVPPAMYTLIMYGVSGAVVGIMNLRGDGEKESTQPSESS